MFVLSVGSGWRLLELIVPVFLIGAHQSSAGVVGDLSDVVVVPASEGGDASIVVAGIEHNQIDKFA